MKSFYNSLLNYNKNNIQVRLKKLFNRPGFREVLEWTFMYDNISKEENKPYNTTFFEDIAGVSYIDFKSNKFSGEQLVKLFKDNINSYIDEIVEIKKTLEEGIISKKNNIQIKGLEDILITFSMARESIYNEVEKTGIKIDIDKKLRSRSDLLISKSQEKLYGPKISDVENDIEMTLNLICKEFSEGKKYLLLEERRKYLKIYDKITNKLKLEKEYILKIPNPEDFEIIERKQDFFTKNVLLKNDFIEIEKKDYVNIWQLYIDSMGLKQRVVENPNASSIYDGSDFLEVPTGKNMDRLPILKVLKLMKHEIGCHYVNQATSENNGFIIRGAGNIEKEEGLAIIMEKLFEGYKLKDIKEASSGFPFILAGELLTKNDRRDFIDIRMKILSKGKNGDINNNRDLRLMRGFSLDGNITQRKDCSYGRGANKMIDIILSTNFTIMDFFKGKFGINDIVNGNLDNIIKKDKIVHPLFFADLIIFILGTRETRFTHDNFVIFLKDKYSGDIPESYFDKVSVITLFSIVKFLKIMKILPGIL